jgi:ribosomal-protein-alanine N-acetyltransferase
VNANFTPFPVLITERLQLRQITLSDFDEIFKLRSDESVNRYLDREKAMTPDDAKNYIGRITGNIQKNEGIAWAIVLSECNKLVGIACLWNFVEKESKTEIGYELLPEYQGKGFMHEVISKLISFVFSTMDLHTIEAFVHPGNKSSIKLLEKNNFKRNQVAEAIVNVKDQPKMLIYTLDRS